MVKHGPLAVGNQYRSIIFTNGTEEARLAAMCKEREQTKLRSSIVTTQIQQLGSFYPTKLGHQKFDLKRHPLLNDTETLLIIFFYGVQKES